MMAGTTAILGSTAVVQKTEEGVTEMTGLQETATDMVTGPTAGKLTASQQELEMWLLTRASLQQQQW